MKKAIIYLTATAMLLLAGCASAPAGTDYTKSTKPVNPQVPADVPDWYMETPSDGEYVYVTGMGNGSNINIALGKAKAFAQQEMSEKISAEVQSMVKNYMQESGVDENQSSINFYESTSKTVSSNTMNGFEVLKKYPYAKPGGGYTLYVLAGVKTSAVQGKVVSQIQNEESMYAEFKASQAFQALEAEVNK
jgi:hypothetical protein